MSLPGGRASRWLLGRKPAPLPLPSLPQPRRGRPQRLVTVAVLVAVATCAFVVGLGVGMRWGVEDSAARPTPPAYEQPVLLPQPTTVPTVPVANESDRPNSAQDSPGGTCGTGKPCGKTCIAMDETCYENEPTPTPTEDSTPTPPQTSHGGSVQAHGHSREEGTSVHPRTRDTSHHGRRKATPKPR
jgi:hypothetical protein